MPNPPASPGSVVVVGAADSIVAVQVIVVGCPRSPEFVVLAQTYCSCRAYFDFFLFYQPLASLSLVRSKPPGHVLPRATHFGALPCVGW